MKTLYPMIGNSVPQFKAVVRVSIGRIYREYSYLLPGSQLGDHPRATDIEARITASCRALASCLNESWGQIPAEGLTVQMVSITEVIQ